MKKIVLSLLLVISLLVSACGAVSSTNYGKGVEMSLDFISNPSTGYDWVYEKYGISPASNKTENKKISIGSCAVKETLKGDFNVD